MDEACYCIGIVADDTQIFVARNRPCVAIKNMNHVTSPIKSHELLLPRLTLMSPVAMAVGSVVGADFGGALGLT